ncbi:hypothetical protein T4B_6213 [Trichinella pseudospiralis]|uniref:Uncharacterized protein n=1 Tax=Trichinella pseudospiralis TaxID=6337 RepID=A0A0V1H1Z2_TRIPS|nr:hypothetical protein T4B_6213 [Trichinella pseudospiralis]
MHNCCTGGRQTTHSTKMMRNDLRRAAGRSETSLIRIKIIRCCWRDGWLGTGRYKNRPHLFESGAKHWVILATCWRAYGTVHYRCVCNISVISDKAATGAPHMCGTFSFKIIVTATMVLCLRTTFTFCITTGFDEQRSTNSLSRVAALCALGDQ